MEKWHLQHPWSRGLFRRCTPQNGNLAGCFQIFTETFRFEAQERGDNVIKRFCPSLKFQHGFSHSGSFHSVQLHKQHSYKSYHSCFGQHLPPSYVLELRRHMVNHPGDPQRCDHCNISNHEYFLRSMWTGNKQTHLNSHHLIFDFVFGVIISVMCTVLHGSLSG